MGKLVGGGDGLTGWRGPFLSPADLEAAARSAVGEGSGLRITSRMDSPVDLVICVEKDDKRSTSAGHDRHFAELSTDAVELFKVTLDGNLVLHEFAFREEDQRELVRVLMSVTTAYLAGEGKVALHRGLFGRRERRWVCQVPGTEYVFRGA